MKQGDHRTRVTKMLIRKAFTYLLRQKPIQSISIKELCTHAGINREVTIRPLQAFAEHYVPSYPPEQGDDLPRAWEWRGEAVIQRNLRIILGKKGHTKPAK